MLFLRTSPAADFTPELNMTSATFLWELECVCLPTRLQTQSTENRNYKSCLWVSRTIPALCTEDLGYIYSPPSVMENWLLPAVYLHISWWRQTN